MRLWAALLVVMAAASAAAQKRVRDEPPSVELIRGVEAAREGDRARASVLLRRVAAGGTRDARPAREQAQFELGKVLYKMGLRVGALSMFERVVRSAAHRYRQPAFAWLVALAREPATRASAEAALADFPAGEVQGTLEWRTVAPLADEARYRRGLALRVRAPEEAVQLFRAVEGDVYYLDARLAEAAVLWTRGDASGARAVLGDALTLAADAAAGRRFPRAARTRVRGAVPLALARMAALEQRWADVETWAARVPVDAPERPAALLEAALARLAARGQLAQHGGVERLGTLELDDGLSALPDVLGRLLYFGWCGPDAERAPADDALAAARRRVSDLLARVTELRLRYEDDAAGFAAAVLRKRDAVALGRPVQEGDRLLVALLDGPALTAAFAQLAALRGESARWRAQGPQWRGSEAAADVLQELEIVKALTEAELGQRMQARLSRVLAALEGFRGYAIARVEVSGSRLPQALGLWVTRSGCAALRPPAPAPAPALAPPPRPSPAIVR